MSTTPPDFPIPESEAPSREESTGSFVTQGDFRPVRSAVGKLVAIERERRGEMRVVLGLLAILIPALGWMLIRMEDVRTDLRELSTEVHTRFELQRNVRPAQDADR